MFRFVGHLGAIWVQHGLQDAIKTFQGTSKSLQDALKNLQDAPKSLQDAPRRLQDIPAGDEKPRCSLCFSRFSMSRACLELSWPDMASKTTSRAPGTCSTASKTPSGISQTAPKASKTPPRASKMLPRHVPRSPKIENFIMLFNLLAFLGLLGGSSLNMVVKTLPRCLQEPPKCA